MKRSRSTFPLLLTLIVAAGVIVWMTQREPAPDRSPPPPIVVPDAPPPVTSNVTPPLSALATPPQWALLNRWQGQVTRKDFINLMETVFTVSPAWKHYFHLSETDVLIETGVPDERFRLRFAKAGPKQSNPRRWRTAEEMEPFPAGKPLDGVRIAIDAGHIGGEWAKIEERWFQIGAATPVQEGDMTLLVAHLVKPRLEFLGAEVTLVREEAQPVTKLRPSSLLEEAGDSSTDSPSKLAERLFYRTAEIRARARKVNDEIQPDLVLCIHFNAEAWGDPKKPTLINRHHFHLLVNGAYTDGEVALADQRFQMVRKIVEGTHQEEARIGQAVAREFVAKTQLPPYLYEINSRRALNVEGNPYLWARNLLANRLYDRPVVFLEPYVMNSKMDYERIQAGDYEGIRPVGGKELPSIFREYADALTDGVREYYKAARPRE